MVLEMKVKPDQLTMKISIDYLCLTHTHTQSQAIIGLHCFSHFSPLYLHRERKDTQEFQAEKVSWGFAPSLAEVLVRVPEDALVRAAKTDSPESLDFGQVPMSRDKGCV